ncbi:drosulfakinins [Episyrphus balteatus]|uniref:drosulfakinins n=1 Tax=Episyrphus balteatus TaxID=286459 RepID=UPI002485F0DC|nr:drosulfakinins [Episyrphus balteatus]
MSTCSMSLFLCTFLLSFYILIVPGQSASSDKYIDSQQKLDNRQDGGIGGSGNIRQFGSHRNLRSALYGFGPRMMQISRSKIPIELDLLVDSENDGERTKRFDDYGHMRFGKRGGEDQFDDYGHMRFGR